MPRGPEQFPRSTNEKPSELNGLPESWFNALTEANIAFPQGGPTITYAIAPHFFKSLANHEVTSYEAFTSKMSTQQLARLRHEAENQHDEFNVDQQLAVEFDNAFSLKDLPDSEFTRIWTNGLTTFSELAGATLNWRTGIRTPKDNSWTDYSIYDRDPDVARMKVSRLAIDIETLHEDPTTSGKLAVIIELTDTGAQALEITESKRLASERKKRIKEDLAGGRESVFGPKSLKPVFDSVHSAVKQKSLKLEEERGIVVPDYIQDWFMPRVFKRDVFKPGSL